MSQQINLYNPIFRKEEKLFSARRIAQGLGALLVALCALGAYGFAELRAAEKLAKASEQQLATQRAQIAKLTASLPSQTRSKALESEIARLGAEAGSREFWRLTRFRKAAR